MKTIALFSVLVLLAASGCGKDAGPLEGHEGGPCTPEGLCLQTLTCVSGVCVKLESCDPGTADCDGSPGNGCETELGTVTDCAGCGNACDDTNGAPACNQGSCAIACHPGHADCDANAANGCETALGTVTDCSGCGDACGAIHGTAGCNAGSCGITCDAGYDDCDGDLANGCETPLDTLADCGACDAACEGDNATGECVDQACVLTCDAGYDDCDGDPANGCEASLSTLTDCGACEAACEGDNATGECVDQACVLTCDAGYDDCDGDLSNGCETALSTLTDCGACGAACDGQNAAAECVDLACVLTCDAGFDDCDGDSSNGCEAALGTADNCGACGDACSQVNATPDCVDGQCELTCDPGFRDCDQDVDTGCEGDLGANPNCGECGVLCAGACDAGSCEACDADLAVYSLDPMDAARAIGLCADVVSAEWVLPDGSAVEPIHTDYDLGHGILDGFGPNVNVQQGTKLLALSSGTARQPTDPGYQSPAGFDKLYTTGHPYGFPKESPSCPGVITGQPHDGVALEITLQVPANAQGFKFHSNFYTYEWPGYICSQYNDFFVALLEPFPAGQPDGNIVFDSLGNPISVNNAYMEVCGCQNGPPCVAGGKIFNCSLGNSQLVGTGFGSDTEEMDHAATGWLITRAPVEADTTVTLRLAAYDSGDGVLDSTALVDNFHWLVDPTTVGTEPDPDPD